MTILARPRALAACALFVVATAGFLAPPASAAPPSVIITRPGDAQVLTGSSFSVDAEVSMSDGGTVVGKTKVTLAPLDSGSRQAPGSWEVAAEGERQRVSVPVSVEYNGKYRTTVTATGKDRTLLGLGEDKELETTTARRDFFVAAPPATPTNVRPVIDKESRAVTLSWSANTEKDLLFYVVQRAKGDGAFSPLLKTDGPGDTSIVDPSTAEAGGEYRYQVVAVRRGATADEGVNSDPSPVAKASVPAPPGPATTVPGGTTASTAPGGTTAGGTTPGGTGSGPGATTGTTLAPSSPGALKKSGTIDLSGFSAIQSQARRPTVRSAAPDTGFTEALPFDTSNTTRQLGEESAAEPEGGAAGDEPEVRELGAEDASSERQRSAAFLAAGLLATVLLMHLLWIKGEVQREPLEAVMPE